VQLSHDTQAALFESEQHGSGTALQLPKFKQLAEELSVPPAITISAMRRRQFKRSLPRSVHSPACTGLLGIRDAEVRVFSFGAARVRVEESNAGMTLPAGPC
jgi:hypothetical protein